MAYFDGPKITLTLHKGLLYHIMNVNMPGCLTIQWVRLQLSRVQVGAYRTLKTPILPVDAASREPHVRFLEMKTKAKIILFGMCMLLSDIWS